MVHLSDFHACPRYTNEDVSPGTLLIGLDVLHADDRMCYGIPPGRYRLPIARIGFPLQSFGPRHQAQRDENYCHRRRRLFRRLRVEDPGGEHLLGDL